MIRKNFEHFYSFPSSDTSDYNRMGRLDENKDLKMFETYLALHILIQIVYRLFYCWKKNLTNICSEISKVGMNLWMIYITLCLHARQPRTISKSYIHGTFLLFTTTCFFCLCVHGRYMMSLTVTYYKYLGLTL